MPKMHSLAGESSRGIELGCVGLAVGWVAGWAMLALLRSS